MCCVFCTFIKSTCVIIYYKYSELPFIIQYFIQYISYLNVQKYEHVKILYTLINKTKVYSHADKALQKRKKIVSDKSIRFVWSGEEKVTFLKLICNTNINAIFHHIFQIVLHC